MVGVTVHRGTAQIGGSCIEVQHDDARLILDCGLPLDLPEPNDGTLAPTLDLSRPVTGVLLSHGHADHHGLIGALPAVWPIWSGAPTRRLVEIGGRLFGQRMPEAWHVWVSGQPFHLGPFRVTPHLTDHSGFDAHMIEIEIAGRRILYTGDFRTHGRKAGLVQRLPLGGRVDGLILEGTNLGGGKPCVREDDLETRFVELAGRTPGRMLVATSAQNLDRIVTLFRAARRTQRTLVVDLYTAYVLETVPGTAAIPRPSWRVPELRPVILSSMAYRFRQVGLGDFVAAMAACRGLSASSLQETVPNAMLLLRPRMVPNLAKGGFAPTDNDALIWSQWSGYLDRPDVREMRAWARDASFETVHTSGHASGDALRKFARSIDPGVTIPVHGDQWGRLLDGFDRIVHPQDGETVLI